MVVFKPNFGKYILNLTIIIGFVFVYYYNYRWTLEVLPVLRYIFLYLVVWFYVGGSIGYYLILSNEAVIVKNDHFFWVYQEIKTKDITDVFVAGGLYNGTSVEIKTKQQMFKYAVSGSKESSKVMKDYLSKFKIPFGTDIWYV
jgi:hypothetical protein